MFSVITPTWNRAIYLERVYFGLKSQIFNDFEWIVADDGSDDHTELFVRECAKDSGFSIIYIRADRHVGKIKMDNEAVRQASGKLILWCDSDDWLLPDALQCLWDAWSAIGPKLRCDYAGITAFAATEEGVIVNPVTFTASADVTWNDLESLHQVKGDMVFCARADLLKAHPFPEVDFVIPESVVWSAIGNLPTRIIPRVLKMVEYRAKNAISFSGNMSYNRGRAYALAATTKNLKPNLHKRTWGLRTWHLITFIRYSLHGEIALKEARCLWEWPLGPLVFELAFLAAFILAFKDRLQGKVRMTHRDFLAARDAVNIKIELLN